MRLSRIFGGSGVVLGGGKLEQLDQDMVSVLEVEAKTPKIVGGVRL